MWPPASGTPHARCCRTRWPRSAGGPAPRRCADPARRARPLPAPHRRWPEHLRRWSRARCHPLPWGPQLGCRSFWLCCWPAQASGVATGCTSLTGAWRPPKNRGENSPVGHMMQRSGARLKQSTIAAARKAGCRQRNNIPAPARYRSGTAPGTRRCCHRAG